MNRKVIYTSLTGGYDKLPQYEVLDTEFDYICFSNEFPSGSRVGQWEIRPIPYENSNKARLSRYVKLNPHKVLSNYGYSVWLDCNVSIRTEEFYHRVKDAILKDITWGGICHPTSDCIYDEAKSCLMKGMDIYPHIANNIKRLSRDNFPHNFGLFENNIILRKHSEARIISIDELWWSLYCAGSCRDQLSLFYIFWLKDFRPSLLLPAEYCSRNYCALKYTPHPPFSIKKRVKLRIIKLINSIMSFLFWKY